MKACFVAGLFYSCAKKEVKKEPTYVPEVNLGATKESNISKSKVKAEKFVFGPTQKSTFFRDETERYGLKGVKATQAYAVDFNNDGFTDLAVLPNYYSIPEFFLFNKKQNRFEKMELPFKRAERASFLVFHDFNKDKVVDLILGTFNQKTELTRYPLRGFKGRLSKGKIFFEEIDLKLKLDPLPTSSIALLDYDLDGNIDLFQGNWYKKVKGRNHAVADRLLKGKGFSFRDDSALLEGEHFYNKRKDFYKNATPTMGVAACDIDLDGYPDILTASTSGAKNRLWMNRYSPRYKGRTFEDYGKVSLYAEDAEGAYTKYSGGNSFYSVCADYNNDGIMDVALGELTNAFDPENKDRSSILTGSEISFPPKFIRTEYTNDDGSGNWSQGDRRGLFVDLDYDGLLDLIVDNSGFPPKSRLVVFKQENDHSYTDVSKYFGLDILNPSGTITLDVNRDGKMDLLIGQTKLRDDDIPGELFLMVNNLKDSSQRSIRFYFETRKSNSEGIGSLVHLKTSKKNMRQFVQYSYGPTPSQNEKGLYFGLGKDQLEYVEVRWPIAQQDRLKRKSAILKKYDLSKLKFKSHINVTLCDNGKFLIGKRRCYK